MAEMEGMIREMVKKVLMAQLYHRYPQALSTGIIHKKNATECVEMQRRATIWAPD
jgi:energy-coupling factor transporter ATP-binding protein EcfA2